MNKNFLTFYFKMSLNYHPILTAVTDIFVLDCVLRLGMEGGPPFPWAIPEVVAPGFLDKPFPDLLGPMTLPDLRSGVFLEWVTLLPWSGDTLPLDGEKGKIPDNGLHTYPQSYTKSKM